MGRRDHNDAQKWEQWLTELPGLETVKFSRCDKPQDMGCQLYKFCDASEQGYGTVSYLRLTAENNRVTCFFVMGQSRVARLKRITLNGADCCFNGSPTGQYDRGRTPIPCRRMFLLD